MAAAVGRACFLTNLKKLTHLHSPTVQSCRKSNTLSHKTVEKHRFSPLTQQPEVRDVAESSGVPLEVPRQFRFVNPEFLPNPLWYARDRIKEMLQREDMYRRRGMIDIPEFYVGSILAVTVADRYAPGKLNRFVGICLHRGSSGLGAFVILRNVVDNQGIEIKYELYSPVLQKIEVLKLEKRLDDRLFYLRDAPQEHSTFPFDMDPVPQPKGGSVPVNTAKVKLNPRPWLERWERQNLQGIEIEHLKLPYRLLEKAKLREKPWEKYDLMKQYRESINEEETEQILSGVYRRKQTVDQKRKQREKEKGKR